MLCKVTNRQTETTHAKKADSEETQFGTSREQSDREGGEGSR